MSDDNGKKVLTKSAYEQLVVAVSKMLAESEKAGREADSSKAKIYWQIGDQVVTAVAVPGSSGDTILNSRGMKVGIKSLWHAWPG